MHSEESAILGVVILTLVSVSSRGHNVIHTAEKRAGIPADGVWFGSLGDHVAAFALQGRRKYMEDRFDMVEVSGHKLYAVMDGHSGDFSAIYLRDNLLAALSDKIKQVQEMKNQVVFYPQSMFGAFGSPRHLYHTICPDYNNLLRDEIAKIDADLLRIEKYHDKRVAGSTLVVAIYDELNHRLWVANVGDSRGVLGSFGTNAVVPLSYDHKPNNADERKRISGEGGFVTHYGVWRVGKPGTPVLLAVSRALGDFSLKPVVSSEPDILSFDISNIPGSDFAILATDGLWDTHSNKDAVDHVKKSLKTYSNANGTDLMKAAETLAMDAYQRGSTDNITVMVIKF